MYGALNRLEEAVDQAGKAAKYQYNGLGHRVGKLEGSLPAARMEQMEKHLNPQSRIDMEIGNQRQISYTIDLTREYHNLLERSEGDSTQTYFWDGNVASYEENGQRSFYLQDELGSPLRIEDETGRTRESYGYGAFGEDLYGNQGELQPFGYTGYQKDRVAGTYYAQAREYQADVARFQGQDVIKGFVEYPISLNNYGYCYNSPFILVDENGLFAHLIVGAVVGAVGGAVTQLVSDAFSGKLSSISTYVGAITGGAAGGAVLAGTGNVALAGAVEGGVSGSVTALGNGIEEIASGKRELSFDTVTDILGDTLVSGAGEALAGTVAGKGLSKLGKLLKNSIKTITGESVDKVVDSTIGAAKKKLFKRLKLTGRNSWESLTKQVYTKMRKGTWKRISLKTWSKMLGFETINSIAKEVISNVKSILKAMIDQKIEPYQLSDEMLNMLKQWTKGITPETINRMIKCTD